MKRLPVLKIILSLKYKKIIQMLQRNKKVLFMLNVFYVISTLLISSCEKEDTNNPKQIVTKNNFNSDLNEVEISKLEATIQEYSKEVSPLNENTDNNAKLSEKKFGTEEGENKTDLDKKDINGEISTAKITIQEEISLQEYGDTQIKEIEKLKITLQNIIANSKAEEEIYNDNNIRITYNNVWGLASLHTNLAMVDIDIDTNIDKEQEIQKIIKKLHLCSKKNKITFAVRESDRGVHVFFISKKFNLITEEDISFFRKITCELGGDYKYLIYSEHKQGVLYSCRVSPKPFEITTTVGKKIMRNRDNLEKEFISRKINKIEFIGEDSASDELEKILKFNDICVEFFKEGYMKWYDQNASIITDPKEICSSIKDYIKCIIIPKVEEKAMELNILDKMHYTNLLKYDNSAKNEIQNNIQYATSILSGYRKNSGVIIFDSNDFMISFDTDWGYLTLDTKVLTIDIDYNDEVKNEEYARAILESCAKKHNVSFAIRNTARGIHAFVVTEGINLKNNRKLCHQIIWETYADPKCIGFYDVKESFSSRIGPKLYSEENKKSVNYAKRPQKEIIEEFIRKKPEKDILGNMQFFNETLYKYVLLGDDIANYIEKDLPNNYNNLWGKVKNKNLHEELKLYFKETITRKTKEFANQRNLSINGTYDVKYKGEYI